MEKLLIACETDHHPRGSALRTDAINNGMWCLTTNIFVFNEHGSLLCHQRSKSKERNPDVWMTHFGGHLAEGETYDSNAQKELFEETGILLEHKNLIPWRVSSLPHSKLWACDYMACITQAHHTLNFDPSEVQKAEWLRLEDIRRLRKNQLWIAGVHDLEEEIRIMRAIQHALRHHQEHV